MAVIHKFPIPHADAPFEVKIKGFCEVVHAGVDIHGKPCFWAIVAPDKPEETWTFYAVPTGVEFDSEWCHVVSFPKGEFMWHLLRPSSQWKS